MGLNYFNAMNIHLQYGEEVNAETAGLVLPRIAKQFVDYSHYHRWFYAQNQSIFLFNTGGKLLGLLTNDTNCIYLAQKSQLYVGLAWRHDIRVMKTPDIAYNLFGIKIEYITVDALDALFEMQVLKSQLVNEAILDVAKSQPEINEIELF